MEQVEEKRRKKLKKGIQNNYKGIYKIRRVEERSFERKIIECCKNEPKIFDRYIHGKMKSKE